MENIDYFKLVGIIGAVITFFITFFNKEQSKYSKLEQEYFEKLLVPYINECMKNNGLNPVRFIKRSFNRKDYFIPSYIFYLVDNDERKLLHKVLVVDYREKYPNNINVILKTMDNIFHTIEFIFIFLYYIYIVFIFLLSMMTLKELFSMVSDMDIANGNISNIKSYIGVIISIIVGVLIVVFFLRELINDINDEYTIVNKKIKNMVKSKVKKYDKDRRKGKYYIN